MLKKKQNSLRKSNGDKRPVFTFVINASLSEPLVDGIELFRQEHGPLFETRLFHVHDIEEEAVSSAQVREGLSAADIVFLDVRGGGKAAGLVASVLSETTQPVLLLLGASPDLMSLVRLGSFSLKSVMEKAAGKKQSPKRKFSMQSAQRMMNLIEKGGSLFPIGQLKHARNWARSIRYWTQGGGENIKNLLVFIGREYAGLTLPKPEPPREYPEFGIYDPITGNYHTSTENYISSISYDKTKPTIGFLFYGGMHFYQSLVPLKALAQTFQEGYGMNFIPLFANAGNNLKAVRNFFFVREKPLIDAVIYLQWFQLATFSGDEEADAVGALKELNVPVFDGAPLFGREVEKWLESIQGFSPIETLAAVILPELDGMIEPVPVAGLQEKDSEFVQGKVKKVVAIPDRVERIAARVANWTRLRRMPNSEKKVAFIIYDNPPGEDNLGSAAYLDTFESLRRLFLTMGERGYTVEGVPEPKGFPEHFLSRGIVNSPRWGGEEKALKQGMTVSPETYLEWLAKIPSGKEVGEEWDKPPGKIMAKEGKFIVPAVEFGNILLGIQPSRGQHADPDKISHDKTLPPHHQYVAFYRWLEEEWKPDVIIHVGTHGTLEFLKGKEIGMSRYCWPESLIGNIPHVYYYHVVNASEATIAKRRSLGTLVNYNSPSFTTADLYDEYVALEDLIDEFVEALSLEPNRAERLRWRVLEKAAELNIEKDTVEEIQEEISLMKRSVIPKGLHILGESLPDKDRIDFAVFFLRYNRGEIPSLHRLLAESRGHDYERLLRPAPDSGQGSNPLKILEEIEAEVREIVEKAYAGGELPSDKPARSAVSLAVETAQKLRGELEIENFLGALDGGYVEPALGGDPLRNPEVLPTGRNSFQFDPRLVPSEEACRRGREIAEKTLEHYYGLNGTYPNSTAVILWGFETTKTRGETVGQILAYLGVRVVEGSNPYAKKIEPVPLEELGRPRVDCLVQICGFFRDMYPNVMDIINRAFTLVSSLDEPEAMNFVRTNTLKLEKDLAGEVPEDKLRKIAAGRIFGPRAGEYGTRTINLIETSAWKDEEEISQLFTMNMSHLYAENIHGERYLKAFRKRLGNVDLVSQVRDSHEYEIMDLDHYYEFFGGLSRSVESVRGTPPVMLISDTTKELIRTETVGEALNRGIRTRLLNPKWIDELLKHDFHGAQKISDRVEYLIGFAATTHAVENWVWSAVTERFILDEEMFQRMAKNNRFAVEEIIKRLLEARQRGYWEASDDELEALKERYLELEGMIEDKIES